ncbi:MAG: NUDIX hydrolase [bacterium]
MKAGARKGGGGRALEPWTVLGTTQVYSAPPWVTVSVDRVRLPDGRVIDDYRQVTLPEFVVIFAQTPDGRVIVQRQYRHGVRAVTLTLPAGMREPGEDPLACAQRELLEETGYASDDWRPLGTFVPNGTYGCGTAHFFAARGIRRVAERATDDLEETEMLLLTVEELAAAIRGGGAVILSTVAVLALATHPLLAPKP